MHKPRQGGRYRSVSAGTSCEDFALYGKLQGLAGKHMLDFVVFEADTKLLQPDFMWMENSDNSPERLHCRVAERLGMQIITGIDNPISHSVSLAGRGGIASSEGQG